MHLGEGGRPAGGPAAAGTTPPGGDAVDVPVPPATDEDLVRQACQGDQDAFAELVRRHHGLVYNLCLRLVGQPADAADATQEVFLRVYTRLGHFRGQARFRTWLYRIAVNTCQDELRRRRRRPRLLGDLGRDAAADGPPPPAGAVLAREVRAAVAAALAALPEPFRVAVVLRDLHHLSYDEIGAVLGLPPGTVRSRIHRGRLLLRDALTRAGWAPGTGGETP